MKREKRIRNKTDKRTKIGISWQKDEKIEYVKRRKERMKGRRSRKKEEGKVDKRRRGVGGWGGEEATCLIGIEVFDFDLRFPIIISKDRQRKTISAFKKTRTVTKKNSNNDNRKKWD